MAVCLVGCAVHDNLSADKVQLNSPRSSILSSHHYRAPRNFTATNYQSAQRAIVAARKQRGSVISFQSDHVYDIPDAGLMVTNISGLTLRLNGARFRQLPTTNTRHKLFWFVEATNIVVEGGGAILEGVRHGPDFSIPEENGFGIEIRNSTRVLVRNLTVTNAYSDCVYIGGGAGSQSIRLQNVKLLNARRNNLTAVLGRRFSFIDCVFQNANGTHPQAGVDIEPDATDKVGELTFENCRFLDNAGHGLYLNKGAGEWVRNVRVTRSHAAGNEGAGFAMNGATGVTLADCTAVQNGTGFYVQRSQDIKIVNSASISNKADGILVEGAHSVQIHDSESTLNGRDGLQLRATAGVLTKTPTVAGSAFVMNGRNGIGASNGEQGHFLRNTLVSNATHGIFLQNWNGAEIDRNRLIRNSSNDSGKHEALHVTGLTNRAKGNLIED